MDLKSRCPRREGSNICGMSEEGERGYFQYGIPLGPKVKFWKILKILFFVVKIFKTSILLQNLPAQAQDLALLNLSQNGLSSPFFFLATQLVCLGILDKQACSQSFFFHHGNTMVLVRSVGC